MRMIWCTFSVIGFHKYKGSPKEVSYLRQEHRHKFNFKVSVEVEHNNRAIEFHMLKRDCLAILKTEFTQSDLDEYYFDGRSCEMLGDVILQRLLKTEIYGKDFTHSPHNLPETSGRQIIVQVDEDDENGGSVTRY